MQDDANVQTVSEYLNGVFIPICVPIFVPCVCLRMRLRESKATIAPNYVKDLRLVFLDESVCERARVKAESPALSVRAFSLQVDTLREGRIEGRFGAVLRLRAEFAPSSLVLAPKQGSIEEQISELALITADYFPTVRRRLVTLLRVWAIRLFCSSSTTSFEESFFPTQRLTQMLTQMLTPCPFALAQHLPALFLLSHTLFTPSLPARLTLLRQFLSCVTRVRLVCCSYMRAQRVRICTQRGWYTHTRARERPCPTHWSASDLQASVGAEHVRRQTSRRLQARAAEPPRVNTRVCECVHEGARACACARARARVRARVRVRVRVRAQTRALVRVLVSRMSVNRQRSNVLAHEIRPEA
eukprot:6206167-Pleurochrysis_carterae.AAC.1